nr:hypothetical protein Iba_chr13cCG7420 [Ipomoea batatas]
MNITFFIIVFHCIFEHQSHISINFADMLIPSTILDFHLVFYCTEIHWPLNNLIIVIQPKSFNIDWLHKGPCPFVLCDLAKYRAKLAHKLMHSLCCSSLPTRCFLL